MRDWKTFSSTRPAFDEPGQPKSCYATIRPTTRGSGP